MKFCWGKDTGHNISVRSLTLLIFAVECALCGRPQPEHESLMPLLSLSPLHVATLWNFIVCQTTSSESGLLYIFFLFVHEYLIIMWSPTVNLIYSVVKCPQSSDGQRQDQSLLGVAGGFLLLMDVDDLDDRVHQLSLYLGVVEDRSSWSRRRRCSQTWVWRLMTATVSLCTQQTNLPIFVLLSLAARGALRNGDFHLSVSLVVCHIFLMQLASRFLS